MEESTEMAKLLIDNVLASELGGESKRSMK